MGKHFILRISEAFLFSNASSDYLFKIKGGKYICCKFNLVGQISIDRAI